MNFLGNFKNNREFINVELVFLLAIILRVIVLFNCGELSGDEFFSWNQAFQKDIFTTLAVSFKANVHTPLYFALLHIWIKLFGDKVECMRALGFLLTLPLVPAAYFFTKKIFNTTCAYYAAIMLAINTFCIYYCIEIRMYSLNLILSLILAFSFVNLLEKFDKKSIAIYIIFSFLLLANYATSPILLAGYFFVGLIYILKNKKEYLPLFLKIHFLEFLICLPVILWIALTVIKMQNMLIDLSKDINIFGFYCRKIILGVLENFFSMENYQIITSNISKYHILFKILKTPFYIFTTFIPILTGVIFTIKALISKNERLYLFLFPSLFFGLTLYILSFLGKGVMQIRYFAIIYPVVTVSFAFGLSMIKNIKISKVIFAIFVFLSFLNPIFSEKSIYNLHRRQYFEINNVLKYSVDLNQEDILFMPYAGFEMNYYIRHPQDKMIPFQIFSMVAFGDKQNLITYFGNDYKLYKRKNVKKLLMNEVINDIPHLEFEKNLYNNYIKFLDKGQRLVYVMTDGYNEDNMLKNKSLPFDPDNYRKYPLPLFLYSKVERDCFLILEKYLKRTSEYSIDYPTKKMKIYTYEKI